jgi:hypothetical protein
MEKHELELGTSSCTMSCNVQLHDCARHTTEGGGVGHVFVGKTHEIAYAELPPIFAQIKQGQATFDHTV